MNREFGLRLLLAFSALLLAGCAATVNRTGKDFSTPTSSLQSQSSSHLSVRMAAGKGGDWDSVKQEFREALGNQAAASRMTFEFIDGASDPAAANGVLLEVTMNDFRYVSPAKRFLLGIMTGNASLDAEVRFVDIATAQTLGTKRYNTSSSAWEGIASPMTDRQVRAVAAEIMVDLKGVRVSASAVNPPAVPAARPEAAGAASPAVIGSSPVRRTEPVSGKDGYVAERLARAEACSGNPNAVLTRMGPGFELYSVACQNGDALAIRCEFGNCRVLR